MNGRQEVQVRVAVAKYAHVPAENRAGVASLPDAPANAIGFAATLVWTTAISFSLFPPMRKIDFARNRSCWHLVRRIAPLVF